MATLLEKLDECYDGELSLDNMFAAVVVANALEPEEDVVRGLVTVNIGTDELQEAYFSDINQKTKEFENLPEFKINAELPVGTAVRQFMAPWPTTHTVLFGTNTEQWLRPVFEQLDERFDIFLGRDIEIVDVGRLVSVKYASGIRSGDALWKMLPTNRYQGRSGSLANLAGMANVFRGQFRDSIYAVVRAKMIAEAVRRFLYKELESEKE